MRAVVQRVARATVRVDGETVGSISQGLLVFLGVSRDDDAATAAALAQKVAALRIFEDDRGRMSRSLADTGGGILCVSQFTLFGDLRRGNRPSFSAAAEPGQAEHLYTVFCDAVRRTGLACETGVFGAHMEVELLNDGPVTIWLDSEDLQRPRRT